MTKIWALLLLVGFLLIGCQGIASYREINLSIEEIRGCESGKQINTTSPTWSKTGGAQFNIIGTLSDYCLISYSEGNHTYLYGIRKIDGKVCRYETKGFNIDRRMYIC